MMVGDRAASERRFTAEDLRGFAALTGGVGEPDVVPEPLLAALISFLLGVRLPGPGTNYLKQELHFLRPAPLVETFTAEVLVTRLRPEKHLCDLATRVCGSNGAVYAEGRALVLIKDVTA